MGKKFARALLVVVSTALSPLSAAGGESSPAPPQRASDAETPAITGAGGTFPAPVYAKWAEAAQAAIGVRVTYNAVGSGAGQEQIAARSVDFGATDAPMDDVKLTAAHLLQFPTVIGAIVVIVNVPRVRDGDLKLTGQVLADIFAGKIYKWNDPALTELNPDVPLPNLPISPIHRYEPSGTSFVFTSYLSAASLDWRSDTGAGVKVKWPTGAGARGNDGVATTVNIIRGAIGYVEYTYASSNHLNMVRLRNSSGNYVRPNAASIAAAAAAADWSRPNFAVSLIDTDGPGNWPIVSSTFVLLPKDPRDPARGAAVMKFFDWAYRSGGAIADQLDYVPLPKAAQDRVRAAWTREVLANGDAVYK